MDAYCAPLDFKQRLILRRNKLIRRVSSNMHTIITSRKSSLFNCKMLQKVIVICVTIFQPTSAIFTDTSLIFSPSKVCQNTQVTVAFTIANSISINGKINVALPGFTRGKCDNEAGLNIAEHSDFSMHCSTGQNWYGFWTEGTVSNSFSDSYFTFQSVDGVLAASSIIIMIDKVCAINLNFIDAYTCKHDV
mmetsp:Transcript_11421/g.13019  ORF Transcript_11421/g.13019 Transcript_11421/m.13019 type:complete len:191 (+) Transcript_11421:110-682(+)